MPRPAAVFVIDIGKNVFPVIRLDEAGRPIQRTRCRRDTLLQFFDGAQAAVVGMEAGAGSQWLARKLQACGHTVGIIPAEFVKPYIKSNKNDVIACWPRENYTRRVWVWEVTCF
jgi:transposase